MYFFIQKKMNKTTHYCLNKFRIQIIFILICPFVDKLGLTMDSNLMLIDRQIDRQKEIDIEPCCVYHGISWDNEGYLAMPSPYQVTVVFYNRLLATGSNL